mmetsp:Transcript_59488/g.139234  ORF Transcript_59488/g.139234 Transcript_59488/m.139234 type:complete len:82 (-) Transcript_59488:151-396(-)
MSSLRLLLLSMLAMALALRPEEHLKADMKDGVAQDSHESVAECKVNKKQHNGGTAAFWNDRCSRAKDKTACNAKTPDCTWG